MTAPTQHTAERSTGKRAKPAKPKPASTSVESRTRSRGRPAIIGLSIAIILLTGLAVGYLIQSAGQTRSVFVTATALERGDVIEGSDLTTIEVPKNERVEAFNREDSASLIGKYVTNKLSKGNLVGPSAVADAAPVDEGTSIVGVSLSTAQLPPYPLEAGDSIRLIDTPINQGDPPSSTPNSIKAKVVRVSAEADAQTGNTIVAVVVDKDQAADLAARAATGRVALVLDSDE